MWRSSRPAPDCVWQTLESLGSWERVAAQIHALDSAAEPSRYSAMDTNWDIRRKGRAWGVDEWRGRYELTPEKFEVYKGKLFWDDEQRLNLLGLLLENVGIDAAIRLGNPEVWKSAVADLNGGT